MDEKIVTPKQEAEKQCSLCGEIKSLDNFYADSRARDGKRASCKACHEFMTQRHRGIHGRKTYYYTYKPRNKDQKDQIWRNYLNRTFGISPEQYMTLLELQSGVCAICGNPETSKNQWGVKRLSVDHDHETGKVRGLLCKECNTRLGHLENKSFVRAAQEYLSRSNNVSLSALQVTGIITL